MRPARNYLAFVIGACLLLALIFCVTAKIEYLTTSEITKGKVVRLNSGVHHPEVSFEARDGQIYVLSMSSLSGVNPGESVRVRYTEDDPVTSASIDSLADIWMGILLLAILTACFIVGGMRGLPFKGDTRE
ncbi:hypothetical protein B0G80_6345 [Paraburkholderia sp. BL6669N2]|uniref:DUF3592 domain-containing protein n=1 Tax=Paraburkholderia sp. BL6669N2 TaxID=1938807 RepID=UPI000E25FC75|nr:DUF3592 domain-containing protein [Paraburkholderia sp. BL6669N2]REG49931.1 hypothetical protein B0G80_6345 [Paraburkholderia sp. BL6669N2]